MKGIFLVVSCANVAWSVPTGPSIPERTEHIIKAAVDYRAPEPTAVLELKKRGLGDDIKSYVGSLISDVASDVSSFVDSGILEFPNGFPTGTEVQKSLGVSSTDLDAQPTQVLNLPSYGNWTNDGWSLRIHGNVYKIPNVSQSKIDDLANVFLVGTSVKDMDATEQEQARNLVNNVAVQSNATGGAVNAEGGAQTIHMPDNTTVEGDFDAFVPLRNTTGPDGGYMKPGNETSQIQTLNVYAEGTDSGNATGYLVPPTGLTIISDIDDILRVTKIYQPKEGLLNTFARPFTPWMNMPDIYANWSASIKNMHFHYLTTTPEQATRNYMDFIYKTYPLGSFDTRPLNFSDTSATLHVRKFLLDKIFQTFPERKFILVADTSNHDVMVDYPQMYKSYPGQVACIFLRNTSSTDSGDKFPYDTSGFKDIPKESYMFFKVPDDLTHLDVVNGQCLNSSIAQNVTFGEQGLPFGLGDNGSSASEFRAPILAVTLVAAFVASVMSNMF